MAFRNCSRERCLILVTEPGISAGQLWPKADKLFSHLLNAGLGASTSTSDQHWQIPSDHSSFCQWLQQQEVPSAATHRRGLIERKMPCLKYFEIRNLTGIPVSRSASLTQIGKLGHSPQRLVIQVAWKDPPDMDPTERRSSCVPSVDFLTNRKTGRAHVSPARTELSDPYQCTC